MSTFLSLFARFAASSGAPKSDDRATGVALVALSALLWGTVGVAVGLLYRLADLGPLAVGFLRLAIAAPLLGAALWAAVGRRAWWPAPGTRAKIALMGLSAAVYQAALFAAIERIGVAPAVLVTLCAAPVIVAALSAWLHRERLGGARLAALGLALAGTALLVGGPAAGRAGETAAGAGLALLSSLGYAALLMCGRSLAGRVHPLQPYAFAFGLGALLLLPLALASGFTLALPAAAWALLAYLGMVPTALAYALFQRGLRTTPATLASVLTLLEPLASTLLAALLLGETLRRTALLGGALLIAAIVWLGREG